MSQYTIDIQINNETVACYSATTLGYAYKTAKEARLTYSSDIYVAIKHSSNCHYEWYFYVGF